MKESQLFLILSHIVLVGCMVVDPMWLKIVLLVTGLSDFAISRIELRRENAALKSAHDLIVKLDKEIPD